VPNLIGRIGWQTKQLLPHSLWKPLKSAWKAVDSRRKAVRRTTMPRVSPAALLESLEGAGIERGETLFVHSSLSRIGEVEGGADSIVAALREAVGESGTIVMPAFTPVDDYVAALAEHRVLDLRDSRSCTGKITEAFRLSPGALRSSHPFCSCVASGPHARFIVADHHKQARICHKDSPLARVLELGGKVVALGSDVDTVSLYHCVEDLWDGYPLHPYDPPFTGAYIDPDGNRITRELLRHTQTLAKYRIDHPHGEWLRTQLRRYFTDCGLLRPFQFGCATAWTMDAKRLFAEMRALAGSGVTIYSKPSLEIAETLQAARKSARHGPVAMPVAHPSTGTIATGCEREVIGSA
jgi:aminoglycoside 3-N-acetyltransferase